ncbi:MAG: hypothetical protein JW820_14960 [Spirochaetales bacterium]|nr:hypothetical protein [Spirochaetales bacterium]
MEQLQIDIHRALSPEERHALGVMMSDDLRDVALDGLRDRHPQLPQAELLRLYVDTLLGWRVPSSSRDDGSK